MTRERGDDREERRARQQDERAGGARAVYDRSARGTSRAPVSRKSVRGQDALLRRAARVARESGARSGPTPRAADHRERVRGGSRLPGASTDAALVVVTTRRDVPWRFGPGERTEEFSPSRRESTPKNSQVKIRENGASRAAIISSLPPKRHLFAPRRHLARRAFISARETLEVAPEVAMGFGPAGFRTFPDPRYHTARPVRRRTIPRAPFRDATTSHSAPPLLPPPPQSTRPSLS